MALVFHSKADRVESWRKGLLRHMPELDVRLLSEPGRVEDVKYALVWKPPAGALRQFPNLAYIFSLGAGVDALFREADLPEGVPVKIGSASCRESVCPYVWFSVVAVSLKKKQM